MYTNLGDMLQTGTNLHLKHLKMARLGGLY